MKRACVSAGLFFAGCSYIAPYARPIEPPTGAAELAARTWSSYERVDAPPRIVFVARDCAWGFVDQNGEGCVYGEYVRGVVYVADSVGWESTLKHELLHAAIGDRTHQSNHWRLVAGRYVATYREGR